LLLFFLLLLLPPICPAHFRHLNIRFSIRTIRPNRVVGVRFISPSELSSPAAAPAEP
jgi:hypothetical protein